MNGEVMSKFNSPSNESVNVDGLPGSTSSVVEPSSPKTSNIAVLALVVALIAAGLAGYAVNEAISSPASVTASGAASDTEDLDLFYPPADVEKFISKTEESIVEILCQGTGTGFAFDLDVEDTAYNTVIVTNYHVIEDCMAEPGSIEIYTWEKYDIPAEFWIRGVDEANDLALIEIVEELPPLKQSEFFASRGWWAMAIGNPVDTDWESEDDWVTLYNGTTFGNIVYVHDKYWNYSTATINGGNSGGPLVNSRGEVIGVNSLAGASTEYGVWNIAIDTAVLCEKLLTCDE
jgi:S1-C subfamily serine protease